VEPENNVLALQVRDKALNTLDLLQEAIKQSHISSFEIKNDGETTTVIIDSIDRQERIIDTRYAISGYSRESTTRIKKVNAIERKEIVKKLFEEGKTQSEIAKETMVSQKTICNDIKNLKHNGCLR